MTARKKNIIGLAFVAVSAGVVWWAVPARVPDPIYEGKHLSYWLDSYFPVVSIPVLNQADAAVRRAGTNAIPLLLRYMRAHDSALKRRLITLAARHPFIETHFVLDNTRHRQADAGFLALGADGRDAVPELIRIYNSNLSEESQFRVLSSLRWIGTGAQEAVPLLIHQATNVDLGMGLIAIEALGETRPQSEMVVPVLINCLSNNNPLVQWAAVKALGNFRPQASAAVPQLLALRNDPLYAIPGVSEPGPREWLDAALKKIDPAAAANAGIQVTNAVPTQ